MAARSGSESLPVTVLWQCCGCKATFPNEKNAKIHVAFHIKAMSAARAPPARPGGADTRRPERVRVRHGPQHPSQSGCCHWPPGPAEPGGAAATAKMQRIVFGARAGARAAGGRAGRAGGTATRSLSGAPADRDESESGSDLARASDSDSDRDARAGAGGPRPRARSESRTAGAGALGDRDGDSESLEGGDHGGFYSNDEDSQEPGKLYK